MPALPEVTGYPYWARRPEPHPFGPAKRTLADRLRDVRKKHGTAVACRICGTPITDPVSVERGVGPECWKKVSRG